MMIQYGTLMKQKFRNTHHVSMDDVTHETYEGALREAVWISKQHTDICVLSMFCINMETGEIMQMLSRNQIESIVDSISESDWDYFRLSRDIPVPQPIVAKIAKLSWAAEAAE